MNWIVNSKLTYKHKNNANKSNTFDVEVDKIDDCIEKGKIESLVRVINNDFGLGEYNHEYIPLNEIKKRMLSNDSSIPPIVVGKKQNDKYCIYDGHHRVAVARHLGRKTVKARYVRVGDMCEYGIISKIDD